MAYSKKKKKKKITTLLFPHQRKIKTIRRKFKKLRKEKYFGSPLISNYSSLKVLKMCKNISISDGKVVNNY